MVYNMGVIECYKLFINYSHLTTNRSTYKWLLRTHFFETIEVVS